MSLPDITATGNLAADPELKFFNDGNSVANFRIGCGARKKNRETGQWEDAGTTWLTCVARDGLAENIVTKFAKGQKIFDPLLNFVTMFSARPSRAVQVSQVVPASSHCPVSRFFLRAPQPMRKFATEFPSLKNLSSGSAARLPVAVISGSDIYKSPKSLCAYYRH